MRTLLREYPRGSSNIDMLIISSNTTKNLVKILTYIVFKDFMFEKKCNEDDVHGRSGNYVSTCVSCQKKIVF